MNKQDSAWLDVITILSFFLSVANLDENIDQTSMSETVNSAVSDIHNHLEKQDKNIEQIMRKIGAIE